MALSELPLGSYPWVIHIFMVKHEMFHAGNHVLFHVCRAPTLLTLSCIKECLDDLVSLLMFNSKFFTTLLMVIHRFALIMSSTFLTFASVVAMLFHPGLDMSCICWSPLMNLRYHLCTICFDITPGPQTVMNFYSWYSMCPFIADNCSHFLLLPQIQNAPFLHTYQNQIERLVIFCKSSATVPSSWWQLTSTQWSISILRVHLLSHLSPIAVQCFFHMPLHFPTRPCNFSP